MGLDKLSTVQQTKIPNWLLAMSNKLSGKNLDHAAMYQAILKQREDSIAGFDPSALPDVKNPRKFSPHEYKVKPVYNVGDFGEDVNIPFDQDFLTGQTITLSTSTFARTSSSIGGTTYYDVDEHTTAYSNSDTGVILHEGNNTQFDRLYVWSPDMDAMVYKLSFNMAAAVNCSAYTNGNISLTSVEIKAYLLGNNFLPSIILDNIYTSGLGNLTATGSQVFIINDDLTIQGGLVKRGQPVIFEVKTTIVRSGTATTQEGILEWFPYQAVAAAKTFSRSELTMHVHAAVSHADLVFLAQSNANQLDFSGITIDGDRAE